MAGVEYTNPPQSRNEAIIEDIITGTQYTDPPQSENEEILVSILNGTPYSKAPQSRMADLLLQLKDFIGEGGNLYEKHIPTVLSEKQLLPNDGNFYDIFVDGSKIVGVNSKTNTCFGIYDTTNDTKTVLGITPLGGDATDLPQDMSAFNDGGNGIQCRNVADVGDYYVVSLRTSSPKPSTDGTHLFGGIVFVSKSSKTVSKCYWLPYRVSRVTWDPVTELLAVGLQVDGLKFYSISGTTLTEVEFFPYEWTSGSPTNGRESQGGIFYTTPDNKRIFVNVGFGNGIRFYDVTDASNITFEGEFQLESWSDFEGRVVHTFSGVVQYPYLYATIAKQDKENPHANLDGILTIDITDLANPVALQFEHIKDGDARKWNGFGDTKPTEVREYRSVLYTNYENGYLVFEIDANGKSTHYCGKYEDFSIYGLDTDVDGSLWVGRVQNSQGYIVHIAEDVEWNILTSLTNATLSNSATKVKNEAPYTANVTANEGYELSTVTVTMGGVDITSTVYSDGIISISSVTGDLAITATATEIVEAYWSPLESTLGQYSGNHCTYTASGNNLSITMPGSNSGLKFTQAIESPTAKLKLMLIADSVSLSQPVQEAKSMVIGIYFYDANDQQLKNTNFITGSSTEQIPDLINGIKKSFSVADVGTATKITVYIRSWSSSDQQYYPIDFSATNLRIELYE